MKYLILLLLSINLQAQDCGEERWTIKTLSDPDTTLINFDTITQTTIEEQISLPKPLKVKGARTMTETTQYQLTAYITGYKLEADRDIHIVISDEDNNEMVIEIVDPECESVKETSRYQQLTDLRIWFFDNIGRPVPRFKTLAQPIEVIVTGIGYYDFIHGQRGMDKNGREIHPVLKMELK